jgi:transglutaminase-like putative cysteine protease
MKKYQHVLIRISIFALFLGGARFASAACDLQIVSAGPCLAGGTAGNPNVGDAYGLKLVLDIKGTPSQPFNIVWTMANISYTNTVTVGAGNGYSWYYNWDLDLDDGIPWSITLDPAGVSGNTNPTNTASGTFTPTPPITATDLFDPQVWNGSESYLLTFISNPSLLYVVFGVPTTHGAQTVLSVDGPADADLIATAPYNLPIFQTTFSNSSASTFSDTNNFVVQLSRTRVNPTILRTNTWASMSTLTTNWTVWLAPDGRCESTNPVITSFVQASLPTDYLTTMTPYDTARSLHQTVMKTLKYEEPPPAIDAVGVLQDGIADCGGYSALLVACLRNVGIPARCISGFRQGDEIPHVRVEFHLPGTEWIIADPTDGNTNDPTGTYAYDFGVTSDANRYVAVDAGDAHILPYFTYEFIQVPNYYTFGGTGNSYTPFYALASTPSVAVEASPSDAATVTGEGAYTAGTSVQIDATANPGWTFTAWSDGNTQNPRTVTVPEAGTNYIANFVSESTNNSSTATITVSANPTDGGTVTGGGTFTVGSSQAISASANSGWTFTSWSDGGAQTHNITVPSGGATYTANFTATTPTCTYTLSATSVSLAAKGGAETVSVKAKGTGCDWTATSNDPFITITSGSSGTGNGTVKFIVPGNTSTSPLTGTITIAGQTVTVNQASGGCSFALSPKDEKLKDTGGTGKVAVTPNFTDCDWTAVSNDGFITVTAGASGAGKGSVSYTVAANTTTLPLTGSISIGGENFVIDEAAAPCEFSLGETTASFSSAGGTSNVTVTANGTNCTWKAVVSGTFIQITSDTSGSGSGTVAYTVEANTKTATRKGTITVGKEKLTITQSGTGAP